MGGIKSAKKYRAEPGIQPWERHSYDTHKSFGAFTHYIHIPIRQRSLQKLTRDLGYTVGVKSQNHAGIVKWSSDHHWQHRAAAYDSHIANQEMELEIKERLEMRKIQIELGQKYQLLALMRLDQLLDSAMEGAVYLTPEQMVRITDCGAKLERLARGEPSEIIENNNKHEVGVEENSEVAKKIARYMDALK